MSLERLTEGQIQEMQDKLRNPEFLRQAMDHKMMTTLMRIYGPQLADHLILDRSPAEILASFVNYVIGDIKESVVAYWPESVNVFIAKIVEIAMKVFPDQYQDQLRTWLNEKAPGFIGDYRSWYITHYGE